MLESLQPMKETAATCHAWKATAAEGGGYLYSSKEGGFRLRLSSDDASCSEPETELYRFGP